MQKKKAENLLFFFKNIESIVLSIVFDELYEGITIEINIEIFQ